VLYPVAPEDAPTEAHGARCYRVQKLHANGVPAAEWVIEGHNARILPAPDTSPAVPPAYVLRAVEREWAKDQLRETLPPGSTVWTILRQVSSSGMSRHISVSGPDHEYLDGLVALALDYPTAKDGSLRVGGGEMDMGFAVVSDLSYALYPHGFDCLGEHCPSNDHANDYNFFSRAYDEEHAPKDLDKWWVSSEGFYATEKLSPEQVNEQRRYRTAKRQAWDDGAEARYSPTRQHTSGDYALNQRWL
jgi:hypothetical protein